MKQSRYEMCEWKGRWGRDVRAEHVAQSVVLLYDLDRGSVGDLGVLGDLNSKTQCQFNPKEPDVWKLETHAFSPSSSTKSSYRGGAFMVGQDLANDKKSALDCNASYNRHVTNCSTD